MMNFLRRHWMIMSALAIAAAAALTVGLVVALAAPALPFLIGLSVFGVAPFAFLATMSIPAAAATMAGIAAGAALAGAAVYDSLYFITSKLDKLFALKASADTLVAFDDMQEPVKSSSSSIMSCLLCCSGRSKKESKELIEQEAKEEPTFYSRFLKFFGCSSRAGSANPVTQTATPASSDYGQQTSSIESNL
jgi:hypothetical protein